MVARVRVGGVWLDRLGVTAEIQDSTIYRPEGWSGDYQAACKWVPRDVASVPKRGALFEVIEQGIRTWGGILAEPQLSGDGVFDLNANGLGSMGSDWQALSGGAPTMVPNTAVDAAIADDLPWRRYVSLGTSAVTSTGDQFSDVATILDRAAQRRGARWWVDSFGEVTYVDDPMSPIWSTVPGSGYGGEADDNFVTHLYGWYVSSVDGVTGEPDGWSMVMARDEEAATQFGRRSAVVDLTSLGLLGGTAAQENIDGRFRLVGGRMGFTSGLELYPWNLRRLGFGAGNPLAMRAGHMLRVPGITDTRSQPTTRASIDIVLGEVTRFHSERRVSVVPVGFTARDFSGALASAQAPQTRKVA